jgi:hypothetical protein
MFIGCSYNTLIAISLNETVKRQNIKKAVRRQLLFIIYQLVTGFLIISQISI